MTNINRYDLIPIEDAIRRLNAKIDMVENKCTGMPQGWQIEEMQDKINAALQVVEILTAEIQTLREEVMAVAGEETR